MNYNPRKSINTAIFFILLLSIVVYGFFQARNLIAGPSIEIESPQNGSVITTPEIEVRGKARNIAFIKLNDRQIFIDDEGYFSEKLIAKPGYNIIKLTTEDRFRRQKDNLIEIVYDAPMEEIVEDVVEEKEEMSEEEANVKKLEENF